MCGFLLGALALIAVFKIAKYARYGRCGGGGHHRRHRGWDRGWDRSRWRGGWMRWLFEELDTSPGQEKSIHETVENLREHARETKAEFKKSVDDIVAALTSEEFDHERVGEAWVKQDKAL